jgi:hypothetical protein
MKHFQLNAISVSMLLPLTISPSPLSAADPISGFSRQIPLIVSGGLGETSSGTAA